MNEFHDQLCFIDNFWTADDGAGSCGCNLPCKQTEYIPKITSYKYPSEEVLNLTGFTAGELFTTALLPEEWLKY